MHAVDVVVHTSTAPEPFGRVIVEGMLSGRPVIATAGGGPEEIIQNGLSGIIIPPEDSRSLAAANRSLLEATPRRERMVSIAKDRAHHSFPSPRCSHELMKSSAGWVLQLTPGDNLTPHTAIRPAPHLRENGATLARYHVRRCGKNNMLHRTI